MYIIKLVNDFQFQNHFVFYQDIDSMALINFKSLIIYGLLLLSFSLNTF